MITLSACKEEEKIKEIFKEKSLDYNEKSGCVFARFENEILGYCLYYLDEKQICILYLEPQDDIMLADGILRSALHIAAERSAMDASYSEDAPESLFEKLGFILDKNSRKLDIDKLFKGCGCCEKE